MEHLVTVVWTGNGAIWGTDGKIGSFHSARVTWDLYQKRRGLVRRLLPLPVFVNDILPRVVDKAAAAVGRPGATYDELAAAYMAGEFMCGEAPAPPKPVEVETPEAETPVEMEAPDEFDSLEQRRRRVAELAQTEMTQAEIADAVGVSVSTVRNDLKAFEGAA